MERLRPRLLKTYSGLRGGGGGGGGGGKGCPGLRLLPAPALWVSPQVDPKRFFSTSSSFEDPDPPPRRKRRQPQRRKAGAKENRAPQAHRKSPGGASCVPPTPLRRNVTHRRPRCRLTPTAPLLCSTPGPPALSPRPGKGDGSGRWDCEDALPELSSLKMDWEDEPREQRFGRKHSEPSSRKELPCRSRSPASDKDWRPSSPSVPFRRCSAASDKDWRPSSPSVPFQSRSAASDKDWRPEFSPVLFQSHNEKASSSPQGSSPVRRSTSSDPTSDTSPLKGVLQLQAKISDDKLVLSLPRDHQAPHANKRQRVGVSPLTPAGLNGSLSEEQGCEGVGRHKLQPVVLLDNQVVPSWLASKSSRKQGTRRHAQKAEDTPCIPDVRSHNQVVPVCGTGATGRKACISGCGSSRWGRRKKPEEPRCRRHLGWKYKAETSLLRKTFRSEAEDNMAASFLSPDSSLKNSALWRRIRASFSLHKKKKILSEAESANNSVGGSGSVSSQMVESPKTPFTRTLGYSICPSSSMVLLLSMSSFSTLEVTLTDAEKVYGECHQKGPISFGECIPPEKMQKCEKIGEGVFGEVFRTEGEQGPVALKIIPIEGSERVNGEPQKTFSEILPEIIISKELSLLADEKLNQTSGFIQLYSVHCVQGAYPEPLLNAWDEYHRLRNSENDRPDFFGDQQLFMVLEFEYGGTDLENMRNRQLSSPAAAKSILHQITASLAVAEESLRFEHRDLHWGNVLVKRTDAKEASVRLNGETHVFPTHGIQVKVIDYTFSRLERDGLTVYCDLSTDEEVFQGRGDYQFDIYRRMREENLNNWADYFPHSNILWLHYLVDKLLKGVTYKAKPTAPSLKLLQKQLRHFSKEVLGFGSAVDLLKGSSFFH